MEAAVSPLPDDVAALKALLAVATRRANEAEARLANAQARESATEAVIAHLKLQIAKLKREQYGASAERTRRLLEQMELQLEDLEADAAEDNAAERALRCVPLGRKAWLFCGSDRGGQRAAVLYTLIQTARLNDVDPQAWLTDVLVRIADCPVSKLSGLLPWNWRSLQA